MVTPYQESYGEDPADDEFGDLPVDWHYGSPDEELLRIRRVHDIWYNWQTHLWECACPAYQVTFRCKHVYRFRRQEVVVVNEEYL